MGIIWGLYKGYMGIIWGLLGLSGDYVSVLGSLQHLPIFTGK